MRRFDVVRRLLEGQSGKKTGENSITVKAHMSVREFKKEKMDQISGFYVRPGNYRLNGARQLRGGVNFTITSFGATSCELLLFRRKQSTPYAIIKIPESYRVGSVYSIFVSGLDVEDFEYAYKIDGPYDPQKGQFFDRNKLILDPYSRAVTGQRAWGAARSQIDYHSRVVKESFRWTENKFPRTPMEDSIIYEMHVRGFTRHKTSGVEYPGTFAGITRSHSLLPIQLIRLPLSTTKKARNLSR